MPETEIVLSGDLDEYRVKEMLDAGVPVDAFGVGTQMGTSADSPYLGGVYKLVAEGGAPKVKLSAGKVTLPGIKQVYRIFDEGRFVRDVITLEGEGVEGATALLHPVMENGLRLGPPEDLRATKDRCTAGLNRLPDPLRDLNRREAPYPVLLSESLEALARRAGEGLTAPRR